MERSIFVDLEKKGIHIVIFRIKLSIKCKSKNNWSNSKTLIRNILKIKKLVNARKAKCVKYALKSCNKMQINANRVVGINGNNNLEEWQQDLQL